MGRSSQLAYQFAIPFALSAEAVGTKHIFGLVLFVSDATYKIYGLPKEPPVTKIVLLMFFVESCPIAVEE
jgi:hypothetical protein